MKSQIATRERERALEGAKITRWEIKSVAGR